VLQAQLPLCAHCFSGSKQAFGYRFPPHGICGVRRNIDVQLRSAVGAHNSIMGMLQSRYQVQVGGSVDHEDPGRGLRGFEPCQELIGKEFRLTGAKKFSDRHEQGGSPNVTNVTHVTAR
jgi:hypothetical protein